MHHIVLCLLSLCLPHLSHLITNIVQILEWNNIVGDKRQVDRLFMDILRSNQNGNICVVSFHHGSKDPELAEEARQLGLEPRYVYRVTQVRVGHRIS